MNKQAIKITNDFLDSLKNKSFTEKDVSRFLVCIRDYTNHVFVNEIANFITHSKERTQGICYLYTNVQYIKWQNIFYRDQLPEFTLNEIPKDIFELLIIENIRFFPEQQFINSLNLNCKQLISIFRKSYKLDKGKYIFFDPSQIDVLNSCVNLILSSSVFRHCIDIDEFFLQFIGSIMAFNELKPDDIKSLILSNRDELILCIMCLMNSVTISLYNKKATETFLTISPPLKGTNETLYKMILSCKLDFTNTGSMVIGLLITDFDLKPYVKEMPEDINLGNLSLDCYNTYRDVDNKLYLNI